MQPPLVLDRAKAIWQSTLYMTQIGILKFAIMDLITSVKTVGVLGTGNTNVSVITVDR